VEICRLSSGESLVCERESLVCNRSRTSNTSQVIDLYIKIQGNFNFNCICVDILKPYMLPAISLL